MPSYLGRCQLGTWLNFYLQPTPPAMPDDVPWLKIFRASDGHVVFAGGMPIMDKQIDVGLFRLPLFLGAGFAVGQHSAMASFSLGGAQQIATWMFDVIAGGSVIGQSISMHYYHRPSSDFIVWQTESGAILRGRSPRIA